MRVLSKGRSKKSSFGQHRDNVLRLDMCNILHRIHTQHTVGSCISEEVTERSQEILEKHSRANVGKVFFYSEFLSCLAR